MKKLIFIGYTVALAFTCKAQITKYDTFIDSNQGKVSSSVFIVRDSEDIKRTDSTIRAKVDSSISVAAPSDTKVGPIKLPTWLLSLLGAIPTFLIFAQFILKRIPTANSVKIQGWLGIVLDAITWFQKDKSTTVSPSAPPPVQNGIEKPALRDLANHK